MHSAFGRWRCAVRSHGTVDPRRRGLHLASLSALQGLSIARVSIPIKPDSSLSTWRLGNSRSSPADAVSRANSSELSRCRHMTFFCFLLPR